MSSNASDPQRASDLVTARSPDIPSVQLRLVLDRLGLSMYYDSLLANSFDDWDTVLEITEQDLKQLSFKLGHRRKLQRAITNYRYEHNLSEIGSNFISTSGSVLARTDQSREDTGENLAIPSKASKDNQGITQSEEGDAAQDYFATATRRTTIQYDALPYQAEQLETDQTVMELAMSELLQLMREKPSGLDIFSSARLPPYEATMLAITAFLHGPGTRLFMWTQEDASRAISAVYSPQSHVDPVALVDLLAMAAIGTLCGCNCYTEALRSSYYFSCLHLFSTCTEANKLSCMRIYSCLSICCTLSHPVSASRLNAAALDIGRTQLQDTSFSEASSPGPKRNWRKAFHSVIFIECWFEYGFDLEKRLTEGEIIAPRAKLGCNTSIEENIQEQVSRVGCLAVEISRKLRRAHVPSVELIKSHMEKLNGWYWALPPMMQLAMLYGRCSEIFSHSQKLAILLVHMHSLSAVAMLHRPVLIDIAKSQLAGTWAFNKTIERYAVYEEYCVVAAQQVSRIAAAILRLEGKIPKHCWMTIFECSNACCILLFSASQKLFYGYPQGIEADFAYIQNFIELLGWCGTSEPTSSQIVDTIKPIFSALKTLWHSRSPCAIENDPMRPVREQQSHYYSDQEEPYDPDMPVFEFLLHPTPTLEPKTDKLPLAHMHIDDAPSDGMVIDTSPFASFDIEVILQQIIDLAQVPPTFTFKPGLKV